MAGESRAAGTRCVLGVDGCPGGWIAARVGLGRPRPQVEWLLLADAAQIVEAARTAAATAVDMPIGLPADGPRACDVLARRLTGPRRSSVFPAPVRAVLGADSYADACARSRVACGRALSRQAWHLVPRITDLDDRLDSDLDARLEHLVVEAHPEVSFAAMAGGHLPAKRTTAGALARADALSGWLGLDASEVGVLIAGAPRPARRDDAADALACAWTAARFAAGTAQVLPDDPPRDARGRLMRILV